MYDGANRSATVQRQGRSTLEKEEDNIRTQAAGALWKALSIPQQVPVPRDIPLHAVSDGEIIFPKHRYERRYVEGWNRYLHFVGNAEVDIRDSGAMPQSVTSFTNDRFSGAGLAAGLIDCRDRVLSMASIFELRLVCKTAQELHRDIPSDIVWTRPPETETGSALGASCADSDTGTPQVPTPPKHEGR
ncbi:MAG: hypothetical protein U1E05_24000 [Patescibacteria group bacterium]|nr:hypothetical protein [Patescibacteria group bacterium]